MPPVWLVAILFFAIAVWKIKRVLRYRKRSLFIREVVGDEWIDMSKLDVAIKYYIYIESWFFISIPLFLAIYYVKPIVPYLSPLGISLIIFNVFLFFLWDKKFSAKKK